MAPSTMLRTRLLSAVPARLVTKGSLTVDTASGERLALGDGTEPRAAIRFADAAEGVARGGQGAP